jgi:hypothetical protein
MQLPHALKEAASIGAAEVLFEWLEAIRDDPAAIIDGDELGSTFQPYLSPDILPEDDARRLLAELAAWDPGSDDGSHAGVVDRYQQAQLAAGLDIARGLIALACKLDRVPAAVQPYATTLAPLVTVLREAIADDGFDEGSVELDELIWS